MQAGLAVLIFCVALGALCVAYFYHFRHRAMVMGPERILSALSRTVSGGEDASEEELRSGLRELKSRLLLAIRLDSAAIAVILASSLLLTVFSVLPELALALSGLAILLICALISLLLLRDILHLAAARLDEGEEGEGTGS